MNPNANNRCVRWSWRCGTVDIAFTDFAESWLSDDTRLTDSQWRFLDQVREVFAEGCAEPAHDADGSRLQAQCYGRIGRIFARRHDWPAAEQALRAEIKLTTSLHGADGMNVEYLGMTATSQMNLAAIQQKQDHNEEALGTLSEAQMLVDEAPKYGIVDGRLERLGAGLWRERAALHLQLNQPAEAESLISKALDFWDHHPAESRGPVQDKVELALCE